MEPTGGLPALATRRGRWPAASSCMDLWHQKSLLGLPSFREGPYLAPWFRRPRSSRPQTAGLALAREVLGAAEIIHLLSCDSKLHIVHPRRWRGGTGQSPVLPDVGQH